MVKPYNDFLGVSVKRHHHHDSSYKGKKLTGNYSFKRFSLLSLHQEAWQYAHRHGVGEVAEFCISGSAGNGKRVTLGLALTSETSKPDPVMHFLPQYHTNSSKATFPSMPLPIYLLQPFLFRPPHYPILNCLEYLFPNTCLCKDVWLMNTGYKDAEKAE